MENLELAYHKARKRKSQKPSVRKFDNHWQLYLVQLMKELKTKTYFPRPLTTFILRDPKTRKICKSDFRDRVVHHALVNVLQLVFEPRFIHDSYASRKDKGTLAALNRFDGFVHKVTRNGQNDCFVLKADIKHYFETVDHRVLVNCIQKRVNDKNLLWLIKVILVHYNSGEAGKGMPLGNWTSQFFANVYLNELDQFVKHQLKAKYYIRYVDDFIILHKSKTTLQKYEQKIKQFLSTLKLELHPTKCKIIPLARGISLLGFRTFYHHKLVTQRNIRKIHQKLTALLDEYEEETADALDVIETLQGWNAYAMHGNTYHLRKRLDTAVQTELEARTKTRIKTSNK